MTLSKKKIIWLGQSATMFGGFLMLLVDVRFEHRGVFIDDWRPWIPIVLCALNLIAIPISAFFWHRGGKFCMMALYSVCLCAGGLGVLFHADGHLPDRVTELSRVWTSDLRSGAAIRAKHPPFLAPLAFTGLGMVGLIFIGADLSGRQAEK